MSIPSHTWNSATGVVAMQVEEDGCNWRLLKRWSEWFVRHGGGLAGAGLLTESEARSAGVFVEAGPRPDFERVNVCRSSYDASVQVWFEEGDRCQILHETVFADGWERSIGTERPWSVGRNFIEQRLRGEEEIQVHAFSSHGAAVMALLRPSWLRHGWRVVEEWHDQVRGIPVVRQRAERMVPLHDEDMAGHEFNPLIMDEAEEVVFAYDPVFDVMREWYTVWNGSPCQRFTFVSIRFSESPGIGDRFLPWSAGPMSPFRPRPFSNELTEQR